MKILWGKDVDDFIKWQEEKKKGEEVSDDIEELEKVLLYLYSSFNFAWHTLGDKEKVLNTYRAILDVMEDIKMKNRSLSHELYHRYDLPYLKKTYDKILNGGAITKRESDQYCPYGVVDLEPCPVYKQLSPNTPCGVFDEKLGEYVLDCSQFLIKKEETELFYIMARVNAYMEWWCRPVSRFYYNTCVLGKLDGICPSKKVQYIKWNDIFLLKERESKYYLSQWNSHLSQWNSHCVIKLDEALNYICQDAGVGILKDVFDEERELKESEIIYLRSLLNKTGRLFNEKQQVPKLFKIRL